MSDTTFIYTLSDPRTGQIRYVGKSDKPRARFRAHLNEKEQSCHRAKWIASILRSGIQPKLEVIDEVPLVQWQFWEMEYIRVFKMLGFNLVNNTIGGDGVTDPPPEVRKKISRARLGKRASPETREKLRAVHAGKKDGPLSDEHKKKLSILRTGIKHTDEAKAKMSRMARGNKRHLGKKHSAEARAKMSKTHSSQRLSPAHRANIALALKGRKRPPEVVQKWLDTKRQKKLNNERTHGEKEN